MCIHRPGTLGVGVASYTCILGNMSYICNMMHEMFLNCGAYEIIMMLNELHKRGYQHLRLLSGFSPTGCSWRWMIYPKILMKNEPRLERSNDFMPFECPYGSTGSVRSDVDIIKLADVFEETYRSFCSIGKLPDSEYVEWFNEVVEQAQDDSFPIAFEEYFNAEEWKFTNGTPLQYPPFNPVDINTLPNDILIAYAKDFFDDESSRHEVQAVLEYNGIKPTPEEIASTIRCAINERKELINHIELALEQLLAYKSEEIKERKDVEGEIHLKLKTGEEVVLKDRIDLFAWSDPS